MLSSACGAARNVRVDHKISIVSSTVGSPPSPAGTGVWGCIPDVLAVFIQVVAQYTQFTLPRLASGYSLRQFAFRQHQHQ